MEEENCKNYKLIATEELIKTYFTNFFLILKLNRNLVILYSEIQ